jgi:hypothetical protein
MEPFKARMKSAHRFPHLGIIKGGIYEIHHDGTGNFWIERPEEPNVYVAESEFLRMHQCNARFWVYENDGWIKLTLSPNQTIEFSGGGQHEEGFNYWHQSYTHDGDMIRGTYESRGRDCDGPSGNWTECHCQLHELGSRGMYRNEDDEDRLMTDGMREIRFGHLDVVEKSGLPDWKKGRGGQYDGYAESMNY